MYNYFFHYSTSNTIIYSSKNNDTSCYYQSININVIMQYDIKQHHLVNISINALLQLNLVLHNCYMHIHNKYLTTC